MRILVVSPTPTHPPNAGNRARVLALTDRLRADGHVVHFAYVPLETADVDAMRSAFGPARLHLLDYRMPRSMTGTGARLRRRLLRQLGRDAGYLWRIDDWYDEGLQPQLRALHARHPFDCVFVEYVFMSRALEAFPQSVLKIVDTHDRFALRHRALAAAGRSHWFSTTAREEARGLRRAHVALAIQDEEAAAFRAAIGGAPTRVVTVGHLLDAAAPVARSGAPSAVFVASANPINQDAVQYFVAEVLPLVLERRPGFTLVLAGEVCAHAPDHPNVLKLGRVERVADAFARAAVAINPVRLGTGMNIKLLESLAAGMPTVSTACGARGLDRARDAMLVVPDGDPRAMAHAIEAVLAEPSLAERFAAAGTRAARDWNVLQVASLRALLAPVEVPA